MFHYEGNAFRGLLQFLEVFFRFFNSRGHSTRFIWCDNGTNLKAGSKALSSSFDSIKWKGVVDKWSARGISWHHILPFAALKGGNWERMVGLSKSLITAIAARDYYCSISTDKLTICHGKIGSFVLFRGVYGGSI